MKTSSNSSCIRDPENFIDSQVDFVRKKKPVEENNLHTCQQLFLSQKEHTACLEDTTSHLTGGLNCEEKVIENLLDKLNLVYIQSQRGMTRNILLYKIKHPLLIRKMLIKVALQSTLIKKQLTLKKKPSITIKNKIKNESLFLTNKVIKDTLMTSLKRQYQIQILMPNHCEMKSKY